MKRIVRHRGAIGTAMTVLLACSAIPVFAQDQALSGQADAAKKWQHFPQPALAPKDAPNVILIMTDDVGFGSTSTFGGPIPTPGFDRLAKNGLRYNEFHTTAMCSPTRAALLTGRNTHAVATGAITNVAIDEPGYTSVIPKSAATIGRVLRDNGYNTAFFGKNHNTPLWETGPMGPFDRWPIGLGFDYFYGFNSAAEDQFKPQLIENLNPVEPSADPNYILDKDVSDRLIDWIRVQHVQKPDNPFFVYLSPGTLHSPHQAPAEWVARFKGQFDMGWDKLRAQIYARQRAMGIIPKNAKLTPRPDAVPAWDSISPQAKKAYTHQMEVAAAQLAHFDYQLNRVLDELEASGQLDNTLILYLQGDNGASMDSPRGSVQELSSLLGMEPTEDDIIKGQSIDGTPRSYSNYHSAWAWAQNSPFPWGKQIASHLGGLRDGLVISWPKKIAAKGEIRPQFHHVIDVAPTIYEAAGVTPPTEVDGVKQQPIDGVSMVYSFANAAAPSTRREQYFEMLGNRSYYKDGWMASTTPARPPFDRSRAPVDPMKFGWELYNLNTDYSQSTNVAAKYPEKLAELKADFDAAARKYNVYPITADMMGRVGEDKRPSLLHGRTHFTFYPSNMRYPPGTFPALAPGWSMEASLSVTAPGAVGPVTILGDEAGGAGLFLEQGRPVYFYNATARAEERFRLTGDALAVGEHKIRIIATEQPASGPRAARISMMVDGREVAAKDVPIFYPIRGTGVVGRYGVRTLSPELANPPAKGLIVHKIDVEKQK